MKKIIISLVLGIIVSILFMVNSVEASSNKVSLDSIEFQVQINSDGSMDVTEIWDVTIDEKSTLYKTFKKDKEKYSKITNIKVSEIIDDYEKPLEEENLWSYHLEEGKYFAGTNEDKEFEIAWGTKDYGMTDYKISYQVEDAITQYDDCAELYWQFLGEEFGLKVDYIMGTIFLPSYAQDNEDIKVWGHTENMNGFIYVEDTNKIKFFVDFFRPGRYVEVRTLFPTEMITSAKRTKNQQRLNQVIKEETVWANEANEKRERKERIQKMIIIIINVVAIIFSIFGIRSIIKNSKKMKQTRKMEQTKKITPSQKMQYYREIPSEDSTPAEAVRITLKNQLRGLNQSKHIGRIFSATLLDLNLKKVIKFEVINKIVTIKILQDNPKELIGAEEIEIFEFLKKACEKHNGEITVKELQKHIKKSKSEVLILSGKIDTITQNVLYQKQLEDKKSKEQKMKINTNFCVMIFILIFLIPIIIAFIKEYAIYPIGMIILAIVVGIQMIMYYKMSHRIDILTQKGVDEKEKWEGLKNYMQDFSMLDKREVPEIVIWEKFLVYATAFGIANKVLEQLKTVYPNINEQFDINHYGYMYLMLNTDFSSSFSQAISSSMSSAYSSATGGGGGFSGGGGGRTEVLVEAVLDSLLINKR